MRRLSNYPYLAEVQHQLGDILDNISIWAVDHYIFVTVQIIVFTAIFFFYLQVRFPLTPTRISESSASSKLRPAPAIASLATQMSKQQNQVDLASPGDTPFTKEELKQYDGSAEGKPIYVAIKGEVFDVSTKRDMYGPNGSYHIFAGKDASRGLGKSSLKPEDAVSDYSELNGEELNTLNDWSTYFKKRYPIVGKVTDL